MTATTRIAELELIPARGQGWRIGLGNLLRKELGQWWTTRLWWIQTLVWLIILNGVTTIIMLDPSGVAPDALADESVQTFFLVGATAVAIGIVLTLQGSIVGEKELGTAAWVMSKPVSRASFVTAKLIAHFIGFVVTSIIVPAGVFLVAANLILPRPVPYGSFAIGLAVLGLNVLFYVSLTLALGCVFKGRGPIAGIGIALILVGQFFKGMLPEPIVLVTPWLLGEVAASFAMQQPPEFDRTVPLIAATLEVVALVFLALRRFGREEF